MAVTNEYFGWTEAELTAALKQAQKEAFDGKSIIGVSAGDVNTSKQVLQSIEQRISKIKQALYAIDSTTYAIFENSGMNRALGRVA